MFIICEGPDNVGKSTLIQNLKNYYNNYTLHTLHYSNVKSQDPITYSKKLYFEMFNMMVDITKFDNTGIICDRSHIGEMVYGPIYRNYSGEHVLTIEKKFKRFKDVWDNLILVTLIDKPERLIEREDGLSFSTDINMKRTEISNFIEATTKSNIKHKLVINIEHNNELQALSIVTDYIDELRMKNAKS